MASHVNTPIFDILEEITSNRKKIREMYYKNLELFMAYRTRIASQDEIEEVKKACKEAKATLIFTKGSKLIEYLDDKYQLLDEKYHPDIYAKIDISRDIRKDDVRSISFSFEFRKDDKDIKFPKREVIDFSKNLAYITEELSVMSLDASKDTKIILELFDYYEPKSLV